MSRPDPNKADGNITMDAASQQNILRESQEKIVTLEREYQELKEAHDRLKARYQQEMNEVLNDVFDLSETIFLNIIAFFNNPSGNCIFFTFAYSII